MKPIVKCSVSNCSYWGEGNNCQAEMIMVEVDRHARRDFEEEFAGEYGHSSSDRDTATSSAETCCHTFKPKSANA